MSTEMIRFLVNHGVELRKPHQYDRIRPFEQFRDEVRWRFRP